MGAAAHACGFGSCQHGLDAKLGAPRPRRPRVATLHQSRGPCWRTRALSDDVRLKYARPEWLTPSGGGNPAKQQQPAGSAPNQNSQRPAAAASTGTSSSRSIPQRALGVDYGTVWTGLAISDRGAATPLRVVRNDAATAAAFARSLVQEAAERGAGGIVVGIPLRPGQRAGDPSSDTPHASRCRSFADSLSIVAAAAGVEVFLCDEARTTGVAMVQADVSATDRLLNLGRKSKNEKKVDAWSAALMLNRFYKSPGSAVRVKLRAINRGRGGGTLAAAAAAADGMSGSSGGQPPPPAAAAPAPPQHQRAVQQPAAQQQQPAAQQQQQQQQQPGQQQPVRLRPPPRRLGPS